MDYTELVKRLREPDKKCDDCSDKDNYDACLLCIDSLFKETADAIEKVTAVAESYRRSMEAWADTADKAVEQIPRWVSVTESLPEEYTDVLCYYEYFRYGDYNCMFRTIDRGYFGNGRWGGEAGQGRKNKVLAWMPLPQPPKEEQ